jgi:hypothetical protein
VAIAAAATVRPALLPASTLSLLRYVNVLPPQENEAKRSRAEKRALDEMKARKQKEKELAELEQDLKALKESTAEQDAAVERSEYRRARRVGPSTVLHSSTVVPPSLRPSVPPSVPPRLTHTLLGFSVPSVFTFCGVSVML